MLKDVEMFFRREMFTDVSGEVSIGFTNITDTAACTDEKFGFKTHHFEGTRLFGVSSKFLEYCSLHFLHLNLPFAKHMATSSSNVVITFFGFVSI